MEVFEQLSSNKTMFNVLLENYPSLLHCRSQSQDRILNQPLEKKSVMPVISSARMNPTIEELSNEAEKIPIEDQLGT